jgi:septum formation protein maf
MYKIILASSSPRRKELLSKIYKDFEIMVSDKETSIDTDEPTTFCVRQAKQKGLDIYEKAINLFPNTKLLVLSFDTIVSIDNKILGKPLDRADAKKMLEKLSGKEHKVYTGVFIAANLDNIYLNTFFEETKVRVANLSDSEIESYLNTDDYKDKAGSYGIQGSFSKFITGIDGDFYNVMGLPIASLYQRLKELKLE